MPYFLIRYIFLFISIILIIGSAVWVYYDAQKFRKKGVNLRPDLIFGLVLISSLLLYIIRDFLLIFLIFGWIYRLGMTYPLQSIVLNLSSVVFILIIPLLVYLILRATRYKKLAALATELGNPPLPPPSPLQRWLRWLFIIAVITLFVLVIILLSVFHILSTIANHYFFRAFNI